MKEKDFFEQYSQTVEIAECRISDYKKFNERYNLDDREYFIEKLKTMGFDDNEILSIIVNKDLLLAMFFNSFKTIVVDDEDTVINIDLNIEKARKKYIDAVDIANQSIEAANEAQKIMLSLKSLIESKSGFNSNEWESDSVHDMNEAIKVYNRLVEKANEDVEASNQARKELAKARSNKQDVCLNNNYDIVLETS